jgi:hypothetical protein
MQWEIDGAGHGNHLLLASLCFTQTRLPQRYGRAMAMKNSSTPTSLDNAARFAM